MTAATLNMVVAVAFLLATNYYVDWLWPSTSSLAITVVAGLVLLVVRGWRRLGAGLIAGAVAVGVLDLAWISSDFISLGS